MMPFRQPKCPKCHGPMTAVYVGEQLAAKCPNSACDPGTYGQPAPSLTREKIEAVVERLFVAEGGRVVAFLGLHDDDFVYLGGYSRAAVVDLLCRELGVTNV